MSQLAACSSSEFRNDRSLEGLGAAVAAKRAKRLARDSRRGLLRPVSGRSLGVTIRGRPLETGLANAYRRAVAPVQLSTDRSALLRGIGRQTHALLRPNGAGPLTLLEDRSPTRIESGP